ncbi:hypothetical protein CEP52_011897 [Fusarium oligoseptatum]|uniref:Uncharacterized protein n=1 Tax=Fusarium oligoseptatum TaxID=2604345 RepID=A0A428T140_9HYPO|nr:hypothetical protein CEP52_011897 [Fusarium oligoseptatum]
MDAQSSRAIYRGYWLRPLGIGGNAKYVAQTELESRRMSTYMNEPARAGNFLVDGADQSTDHTARMAAYIAKIDPQINGGGTAQVIEDET